jgi:glycosyltransferase involved in cell wall biosynthesis
MKDHLSIVIPVYGSPATLPKLAERLALIASRMLYTLEVILVNDRCPQGSWEVIKELQASYPFIRAINLSRNFGQHYAITAGLEAATGTWIVVMDCDLQDMPEEIPNLLNKAQEGYDIVLARRSERNDGFFKKLGSKLFYKVLSYMTNTKQDARIANFGVYHRKVINAFLLFKEQLRFFPVAIRWLGFNAVELDVKHQLRDEGKSSYNFSRLISLATDVIVSFSDKPMYLLVRFGAFVSTLSIVAVLYFLIAWFTGDIEVQGWTSLMVSLWFMFGMVCMFLGLVGLYVAKAFDESKQRPIYIIDEEISNTSDIGNGTKN